MKVLRVCRTLPTSNMPGQGLNCFNLTNLSKYDSTILTKQKLSEIKSFKKDIQVYEMHYKDLAFESEKPSFSKFFYVSLTKIYGELVCLLKIFRILAKEKHHIIHVHSINYLISGFICKKFFKIPLVLSLGGTDFYRAKEIQLFRFILKRVDKIFTVSRSIERESNNIFEKKNTIYTGNGFNEGIYEVIEKYEREDRIITVGNLRWQKNQELLLRAFAIFSKHNPSFKLSIVGNGPEKNNLLKLSKVLGVEEMITFHGILPPEEIVVLLNKSKVFCLTSKSEGFPKALLEAMACGLPCIVTDVGDCSHIIDDNDLIADEDASMYADKIKQVLISTDRKLPHWKSVNRSKEFSWPNVTKTIDNYYALMVDGKQI